MNNVNMFSAKKVKLHGMTSTKWTTKDQITQYKGLINLYTRDRKIMEMDSSVAKKRHYNELKRLQKEVDVSRKELDNAIGGDKQQLRNTLADHRVLQLAYQNSTPKKVIETVNHLSFIKRKELDRLEFKMKLRAQRYIDLKLTTAQYEDRIKYNMGTPASLPDEQQAQIITGKVQDAILKREAALAIKQTYQQIIVIMKKDAIYFNAIIATIENDGMMQGKCMINATTLGQLATEYLDDRRQEFESLEQQVKRDILMRKKDLSKFKDEETEFSNNIKNLIRRDSDINIGKIEIEDSDSCVRLQEDINELEDVLTYLKNNTHVPDFPSIYECIQQQQTQKQRLEEMVKEYENDRAILMEKTNHACRMKNELESTMVSTTTLYNKEKVAKRDGIKEEEEKQKKLRDKINNRYIFLADMITNLKQLQHMAKMITLDAACTREFTIKCDMDPPDPEETDGIKIIDFLLKAYTKLMQSAKQPLPPGPEMEQGLMYFENLMTERHNIIDIDEHYSEESLVKEVFIDLHVFSRDDIKKQSEEICLANEKKED